MNRILKLTCFILVPVSILSCKDAKNKAINNAIENREFRKGNEVLSFEIAYEKPGPAITTVYYNAECQKDGESDVSRTFDLTDSVQVWKTGDGHYQSR